MSENEQVMQPERDDGVASASPSSDPVASSAVSRWSRKRVLGVIVAVGVTVIGAAELVIPALIEGGQEESSADTLVVRDSPVPAPTAEATPETAVDDEATDVGNAVDSLANALTIGEVIPEPELNEPLEDLVDWLIPVSAPFEEFPMELAIDDEWGNAECSVEQLAWLDEYATRGAYSPQLDISVHNTADTGAAMSLENLRFDGDEVPAEAWVSFTCPSSRGDGMEQVIMLELDGSPAVWGEAFGYDDDEMPEGSPVAITLAAGELAQLTLDRAESVDRQRAYEGRIIADLAGSSDETVILADNVSFARDPMPGYELAIELDVAAGEYVFQCGTLANVDEWGHAVLEPCTPYDAVSILQEIRDAEEIGS